MFSTLEFRSPFRFAIMGLILALLAGCDSSGLGTPAPGPSSSSSSGNASTSLSSSPRGAAPRPQTGVRTITVSGVERSFLLYVPGKYALGDPAPLLLDFHGIGGNPAQQKNISGYQAVADREGFLVAYPEGIDRAWNIGPCCTFDRGVDDVAFARGIVDAVANEANVDSKRVYAAGFSMGGGMSHHLACHAADVFAAVAPSAFDLLQENVATCVPKRPVAVLLTRGTADTAVSYTGGASTPPNGLSTTIHFLGAEPTTAHWAQLNRCSHAATPAANGCVMYTQCAAGVEVGLCTVPHGGHAPGSADTGWEFLSRHILP